MNNTRPNCQACRDLDADCPICAGMRAGFASREARRAEAVAWINDNLVQQRLGQQVVCMPQDPDEVILMVMSILAYAREPKGKGSAEPVKCERFTKIEWRDEDA